MVDETGSAFIVRIANRLVVSLLRQRATPPELQPEQGRGEEVAANIAKLPDLLNPRKTET
jgi:hypothetical protein